MIDQNMPWIEARLSQEIMDYLWDRINQSDEEVNVTENMKHKALDDKNNWFYENILKESTEYLYYKDWNNYYDVHITKIRPPSIFTLREMWANFQKQHEFLPPHVHRNGEGFSFVVFMKIPTHWKEQHKTKFSVHVTDDTAYQPLPNCASDFQFLLGQGQGTVQTIPIPLNPEDEGRLLFFPAWLMHQVFPFYGTEEERVTISGNITLVEN